MKYISFLVKECSLIVALLMLSSLAAEATNVNQLFKTRRQTNTVCPIHAQLSYSDTIPIQNMGQIYAFSIDATITQPREGSFVRIVLEDKDGHDYLVAESDRFRNDTTTVLLSEYCEETACLNGIIPVRLKCYLAADAALAVTSFHVSDKEPMRKSANSMETAALIKEVQVQDIVDRINRYNVKHGKLWWADVSERALTDYNSRNEFRGEIDAYTENLRYYAGGIYDIGEMNDSLPMQQRNSSYIPDFDWRDRHGRNWITSIKNQGNSGYCTAFAINGMLEARTNIYYNRSLNLNLSEQDIVYNYARQGYEIIDSIYKKGMYLHLAMNCVRSFGVIDEDSEPFVDQMMHSIPARPLGNECVQINSSSQLPINSQDLDPIKASLIHNGPGVSGFRFVNNEGNIVWHATTLVGYHTIEAGDTIREVKIPSEGGIFPYSIIPENHPFIGRTYWVMKDSYGEGAEGRQGGGYLYLLFKSYSSMYPLYYTTSPITCRQYTNDSIAVEDADGDGYFNWGIGSKPSHCPAWAPDDDDGDDSDPTKGHMDEFGFCNELPSNHPVYEYIVNDSTLTNPESRTAYLGILRGATVTFQTQQSFSNNAKLLLDNGATLILNGTLINGTEIQPYAGSKIILNNGARISKPFEVPVGVELIINQGSIE